MKTVKTHHIVAILISCMFCKSFAFNTPTRLQSYHHHGLKALSIFKASRSVTGRHKGLSSWNRFLAQPLAAQNYDAEDEHNGRDVPLASEDLINIKAENHISFPSVASAAALAIAGLYFGALLTGAPAAAAAAAAAAAGEGAGAGALRLPGSGLLGAAAAADPQALLAEAVEYIRGLGPAGVFYFMALYTTLEILAFPATPLTISSGYLFGAAQGTAAVWVSAVTACGVSFLLGRTFFRERILAAFGDSPQFQAIDRAVGKEGFKLILLLRLSPLFPFALSNYLYGLTSVNFWQYLVASAIGFLPGTIAYTYTGQVGKSLAEGSGGLSPAAYVAILGSFVAVIKVISDIAQEALAELNEEEEGTGGIAEDDLTA